MRFTYNGNTFEAVERPTFGEIDLLERATGLPREEWSRTLAARANIFWTLRRVDPALLSWADLADLTGEEFEVLPEAAPVEAGDVDPPAQATRPTAAPPPSGTPSTWPAGRQPAGEPSPTAEPATSSTSPSTSG